MSTQNVDPNNRDFQNSVNARPVTRDELAYRDGYVRGKTAEQLQQERRRALNARMHEENARLQADNGVSTGLVLGLVLAAVAAVIGGILFVSSSGTTVTPVPEATTPEATTPEPTNNETTVIERTIERTQEVVPAAPAPVNVEPPQIDVELTNPVEPAPAPEGQAQPETDPNQVPSPEAQPQ